MKHDDESLAQSQESTEAPGDSPASTKKPAKARKRRTGTRPPEPGVIMRTRSDIDRHRKRLPPIVEIFEPQGKEL